MQRKRSYPLDATARTAKGGLTMYRIIGTDRRYGTKECYGEFKTLRDCVTHMNTLMRSWGNIMTKNEERLEVAYDILEGIFKDFCHDKKIAQAEKMMDIMRQLILFSETYGKD